MEHHILLMKAGYKDTDIDKFFRIVLDKSGADWTFICPPDYKNIPFKDKRIEAFYFRKNFKRNALLVPYPLYSGFTYYFFFS